MADVLTPEQRHKNMSRIRSKDTKPEVWLRHRLFDLGYRYRKNVKYIPGHPDIWMKKYNTAIFVHGCFWHRHEGCRYTSTPKSQVEFWTEKFQKNVDRDNRIKEDLEIAGIKMLIVWECTIKQMIKSQETKEEILQKIGEFLLSNDFRREL